MKEKSFVFFSKWYIIANKEPWLFSPLIKKEKREKNNELYIKLSI